MPQAKVEQYVKSNGRRRIWQRIVSALAAVVVFCTTYALILPAITMEQTAFCGLQEHIHDDSCYTPGETLTEQVLICQEPEVPGHSHGEACYLPVHTHTDGCYVQGESELVCTLEETAGHSHSGTRSLICGQEASEAHTHDDSCYSNGCYDEEGQLLCALAEAEEHFHCDACYVLPEPELVCTLGERTEPELICQEPETPGHSHGEACYEIQSVPGEPVLNCDRAEHTHQLMCYSDASADLETEKDWTKDMPEQLSGIWHDDLLTIARLQLGYQESTKNYIVDENGVIRGYTRYGAWYDTPYAEWTETFIRFCLHYAQLPAELIPMPTREKTWTEVLTDAKMYHTEDYTPVPGDLMFIAVGETEEKELRIGIVINLSDDGYATAIFGDVDGQVTTGTYHLTDPEITGFAQLPDNTQEETVPETTASETVPEETVPETNVSETVPEETVPEATVSETVPDETVPETTVSETIPEETVPDRQVADTIVLIDALPSADEVETKLAAYEEAEDWDGYEQYILNIRNQALSAYVLYEDLPAALREKVTNLEKLLDLEWMWAGQTLEIVQGINVMQVNSYNSSNGGSATTLFKGGSAYDYGVTFDFSWWSAIVVEEAKDGTLYVSQIDTAGGVDKSHYEPQTANGFVLLIWHTTVDPTALDIQIGDTVYIPFDYAQTSAYSGSSYGTVTFEHDEDNSGKLNIIKGADTNHLIEVNLYDYGDNINNPYISNSKYPGFQQDFGTTNAALSKFGMNFGNNITSDYDAGLSSITVKDGSTINATKDGGFGLANVPVSNVIYPQLIDGYPALADGTSLKYLFHGSSAYATKKNQSSINGLFLHNPETGAYTFNSRENHAQFNSSNDTFTLYKQIISSNFMMYPFGNFLPFNDIVKQSAQVSTIDRSYLQGIATSAQYRYYNGAGDEYAVLATELKEFIALMDAKYGTGWAAADAMNEYFSAAGLDATFSQTDSLLQKIYSIDFDQPTNFFFGMEMKMSFIQPKNGLTGNDGKQPMVFYFTGDDDVWVYIDGVLFLDLSGIHRHVGGEIDFVNGLVKYYALDVATGDVSSTPYKSVTFAEILGSTNGLNENGTFTNYSTHSFNFYYIERGAGSGVCRMNFNFPLLRKNSLSVSKELTVDDQDKLSLLGSPDFRFQVLKADSNGNQTNELFIGANVNYTIYNTNNEVIGTGSTDANGVFTLKAGQRAEFSDISEDSGKYYVRELLDTDVFEQYGTVTVNGSSTTTNFDILVGNDTFTGVTSPVKDASDGTTAFNFNNQIAFSKLGSLEISKVLETYPQDFEARQFQFYVTLDGSPLPVGTEYLLDGTAMKVTEAGTIIIPAGSTAVIPKIIAGTVFTVEENAASAAGYTVTYTGASVVNGKAAGTVGVDQTVQVTVTNSENGASLAIPIEKLLSKSDGVERIFRFQLEQVTDLTGETLAETGITQTLDLPVTDSASGAFDLYYAEAALDSLPAVFYYRITENPADGVICDDSIYVVEVTVAKDPNGQLQATATNLRNNGTEADGIRFTNTLTGSLSLFKTVVGMASTECYEFSISLSPGDSGLDSLPEQFQVILNHADQEPETVPISFNSGTLTLTMTQDESLTVLGIPYGAQWSITENSTGAFIVSHKVNGAFVDGAAASGSIGTGETQVEFINTSTYQLPDTGGIGTTLYTTAGLLLILSAVILLFVKKRGKEAYS